MSNQTIHEAINCLASPMRRPMPIVAREGCGTGMSQVRSLAESPGVGRRKYSGKMAQSPSKQKAEAGKPPRETNWGITLPGSCKQGAKKGSALRGWTIIASLRGAPPSSIVVIDLRG